MPAWSALIASRARAMSFAALYKAATWLYGRGQQFWDNLSGPERSELGRIIRKSKGRRANLTESETERLRDLVRRGFSGERPR